MQAALEMRDVAHRLLTYEAGAGKTSEPMESHAQRVYKKLRQSLVEFLGVVGFQSLESRALKLARPEAIRDGAAQIASEESLLGLEQGLGESRGEIGTQIDMDKDLAGELGILLIANLLELLLMFLGEALTLSLLRNGWPGEIFDDGNAVNGRKA